MRTLCLGVFLVATNVAPAREPDWPRLKPVAAASVRLTDSFWAPRLQRNREVTLPHVLDECERTGRLANFDVAARKREGGMSGYFFNDSDVYKAIEGAAVILQASPDAALEARCDAIIDRIVAAQAPDGYLYTSRQIMDPKNLPPGGAARWSNMESGHELYCAGHLYEAGVAYARATGHTKLLDAAVRNADLVCGTFGPGKDPHPCGHPEVELGLIRLWEWTHDAKYLNQARFFLDTRGKAVGRRLYGEYAQDHAPVLEQHQAVGHAVRLAYLFGGAGAYATANADPEASRAYGEASLEVWDDVVAHKMYVTGGIGSEPSTEGFGPAFDLPNAGAYNETCASIAFVNWSGTLGRLTGQGRYADAQERTLYNAMLSGWSLGGDQFFYPNPLESGGASRQGWFACACCPPNVVRFIASVPGMIYALGGDDLYVNQYIANETSVDFAGGKLGVVMASGMPWEGHVTLTIHTTEPRRGRLHLRVPGWAEGGSPGLYTLDGAAGATVTDPEGHVVTARTDGYAVIARDFREGDVITVDLPMDVRRVRAKGEVKADAHRAAWQRGALVYCVEGADQPEVDARSLVVAPDASAWKVERRDDMLGGVVTLVGDARPVVREVEGGPGVARAPVAVRAIPYFAWANRAKGPMCVWLAEEAGAAAPGPAPTIARRARASASVEGDLGALSDQVVPSGPKDHHQSRLHWWPRKGTTEWVRYDLAEATTVTGVSVYWFDDTGRGECRVPASWRVEAMVGGEWRPVEGVAAYPVLADGFSTVTFPPVTTTGLRLVVTMQAGWAGGIYEWRVLGGVPGTPEGH